MSLFPDPIQTSLTVFVDDTADKAAGYTKKEAIMDKKVMDEEIEGALRDIGIELNSDKQENVIAGPHQFDLQALRNQLPDVTADARYLGARHVPNASPATEIGYRLAAMHNPGVEQLLFLRTLLRFLF